MRITEKMAARTLDNMNHEGVTIAFLGDSVTQGCFEIYKDENNKIETIFDPKSSYERYFQDMLATVFPKVPVNIINAGISGDRAPRGLVRIERDVLRHQPDLVVVCYGLNDSTKDEAGLSDYTNALRGIFEKVQSSGSELIFMTPNMTNTKVSPHITDPDFTRIAEECAARQNNGIFDLYINSARTVCNEMGVTVCDCYAVWRALHAAGADVTELLANRINHPSRDMNRIFAYELLLTILK